MKDPGVVKKILRMEILRDKVWEIILQLERIY